MEKNTHIGIIGGGPAALFMYKRLVEHENPAIEITIFEKKSQLGAGMPYSSEGANDEHITNVSANEIPEIVTPVKEWLSTLPKGLLERFRIDAEHFNEYRVLPRLFFGTYLSDQFELLIELANEKGIRTNVLMGTRVDDIRDNPVSGKVNIVINSEHTEVFDTVIICTGHNWPSRHEGTVSGYFDSPYPPSKLKFRANHAVAIKGASLTAIDAIRTLARHNGIFTNGTNGDLIFEASPENPDFRIVMHNRSGFLPAVRFHLEDSLLKNDSLLTHSEIQEHRAANDGFLSLDYIFEKDFKDQFKEKDPGFYSTIKDMDIEAFVSSMMELRERLDAFQLLRAEYVQAEKSIKREESIYWKEILAVLSFAMNYPAKYLSAEDMIRLQKTLMPLISLVIAFIPQTSCRELLALHSSGRLVLEAVGNDSREIIHEDKGITLHYTTEDGNAKSEFYQTFVDCIGQPHLSIEDFPFKSLVTDKTVSPAKLRFRDQAEGRNRYENDDKAVERDETGNYYLKVSGIGINDNFQVTDPYGAYNERIYIMAVPYIGGFNPDYSGLDFCEEASGRIAGSIFS